MAMAMSRTAVVALGEIGRSPRSRYHALSLAERGSVYLIGYAGSGGPSDGFPDHPNITPAPLTVYPPEAARRLPAIFNYAIKTIWQALNLLLLLLAAGKLDAVLCQNPPAIPTLVVCRIYCLVFRAKFIIDWHNYGYSIMALAHGENSLIVRIAKKIEFCFGRQANASFCVSQGMKNDLLQNYGIQSKLLYDCPPETFRSITDKERHDFLLKLSKEHPIFGSTEVDVPSENTERKLISEQNGEGPTLLPKRPGILFSSTSWTVDEDFSILLNALEEYDKASLGDPSLPQLICVITGKGPMKEFYIKLIDAKRLKKVRVITPWLELSDYPLLVASADLGVCLHTSSSGLDLPMKIVDMFGCGLPVCAYKYPCLAELVKEGENGYMFEDSDQLAELIKTWFWKFPNNEKQNDVNVKFKKNLKEFQNLRWNFNWENRAKSFFE